VNNLDPDTTTISEVLTVLSEPPEWRAETVDEGDARLKKRDLIAKLWGKHPSATTLADLTKSAVDGATFGQQMRAVVALATDRVG